MKTHSLNEHFSVAPQVGLEDLKTLSQQGFRSVLCLRPDGEAEGQPAFASIQAEAAALGMTTAYLPLATIAESNDHLDAFDTLIATLPKPVLSYCRSGLRAASLWALSELAARPAEEVQRVALAAGYNVSTALAQLAGLERKSS